MSRSDGCANSLPAEHGGGEMAAVSDDDLAALLLIRRFEEAVLELFAAGKISGTTHTCLGQEYVPVALAPLLHDDFVLSNHRGHGHYLAHCADPEGLLAEIMGREGAICRGVGGSQHLRRDGFLATGVQGESLPVAVGVGLHLKRADQRQIAVAYVGDGTWGEGAVYEALNIAALWAVPLLVVVENNGIAQSTPTHLQMAGTVGDRVRGFGIAYHHVQTMEIAKIRTEMAPLIARIRSRHLPAVVEFDTVRLGPHSKGDDTRLARELDALQARDWATRYAATHLAQFEVVDARQRRLVTETVRLVSGRPPTTWGAG
jgi:acetoin:2,6-dichlorophenolindophenol oxidoreductase subunit alpha